MRGGVVPTLGLLSNTASLPAAGTMEAVAAWLTGHGLGEYVTKSEQGGYDSLAIIRQLGNDAEALDAFGKALTSKPGHQLKAKRAVEDLLATPAPAAPPVDYQAMTIKQLREHAKNTGIDEDAIEAARDHDNAKCELIKLITAVRQSEPEPEGDALEPTAPAADLALSSGKAPGSAQMVLYHGTSLNSAEGIVDGQLRQSTSGLLGPGIYLAELDKAKRFALDAAKRGLGASAIVRSR